MGRLLLGCKTEAKLKQSVARILRLVSGTSGLNTAPVKLKSDFDDDLDGRLMAGSTPSLDGRYPQQIGRCLSGQIWSSTFHGGKLALSAINGRSKCAEELPQSGEVLELLEK
jgi:hypothetical protein